MPQLNDLSRSLVALDQDSTIIAVVEMSQSSWLVGGVLPGIERQPRKKLEPSAEGLLGRCIAGAMRQSGPVGLQDQATRPPPLWGNPSSTAPAAEIQGAPRRK